MGHWVRQHTPILSGCQLLAGQHVRLIPRPAIPLSAIPRPLSLHTSPVPSTLPIYSYAAAVPRVADTGTRAATIGDMSTNDCTNLADRDPVDCTNVRDQATYTPIPSHTYRSGRTGRLHVIERHGGDNTQHTESPQRPPLRELSSNIADQDSGSRARTFRRTMNFACMAVYAEITETIEGYAHP